MNQKGQQELIVAAIVAILSFMVVNNYVQNFLITSKWTPENAAPIALIVSVIIVGFIFGVV